MQCKYYTTKTLKLWNILKKTGKSDGLLASDWIVHITKEVGEAIKTILPSDFNDGDIRIAIEKVQQLMRFPASNLQEEIDKYYNRI